jgi:hypothetical protein
VEQLRISFGRKAARALVGGVVASAAVLTVAAAMESRSVRSQHAYGEPVVNANEGCPDQWDPMFAEGEYAAADTNGDGVVCTQTTPDGELVIDNQT